MLPERSGAAVRPGRRQNSPGHMQKHKLGLRKRRIRLSGAAPAQCAVSPCLRAHPYRLLPGHRGPIPLLHIGCARRILRWTRTPGCACSTSSSTHSGSYADSSRRRGGRGSPLPECYVALAQMAFHACQSRRIFWAAGNLNAVC